MPNIERSRCEYQASDPTTGVSLPGAFRCATNQEIETAMRAAQEAFLLNARIPSTSRAELLERIAESLQSKKDQIVHRASQETGLSAESRLAGELDRTCSVLLIFSQAIHNGEVQDVRITTASPDRRPSPRPDVRRMRVGIGPVVVVEASNFPLAFGVMGGDAASAMAAGCPVIAKVHPLHPGTSELVGAVVAEAIRKSDLPAGLFSLIHGGPEETLELVRHPLTRGVGFTGSRAAGRAIRQAASERPRPLDELSLEMGSLNPVFLLPTALAERGPDLARELCDAILIGGGQFCTKPGHVFVPEGPEGDAFIELLVTTISRAESPTLLATSLSARYKSGCEAFENIPSVSVLARGGGDRGGPASVQPLLFGVSAQSFLDEPSLREEVFGPMSLIIRASKDLFLSMAEQYEGELTATIHGSGQERSTVAALADKMRTRVGRLLFQGFSPGVELCDGVNHGGPWPSALGRSTVVGTNSYERWLRPLCLQDTPHDLLPMELQPDNPLRLARRVDGRQEGTGS